MFNLVPPLPECKPAGQSGPEKRDIAEIPVALDLQQLPIIARHWFGWQHLADVAVRVVQRIPPPEWQP